MHANACVLALLALSPALAGCASPATPPAGNATAAADDATVAALRAGLANVTAERDALATQLNQTLAYNQHLSQQNDLLTTAYNQQRAANEKLLDANAGLSNAYNYTLEQLNATRAQLQQCEQNATNATR